MNIEEAIKNLKVLIGLEEFNKLSYKENKAIETLLTAYEKQSKEIEHQIEKIENQRNELAILNAKQVEFNKLVNTVNSYKGQFKKQQKEIEELKEDNKKKSIVIIEYQDLYEKLQDKIKTKIEDILNSENSEAIEKLIEWQSLLEKE